MNCNSQKGQSLVEYSLIIALIAIVVILVTTRMGLQLTCRMAWLASSFEAVVSPNTLAANNYMATNCAVLGPPYDSL